MPPHGTSAACSLVPVIFIAELDLLTPSQLLPPPSICAKKMCNGFTLMFGEVTMDLCDVTGIWRSALSCGVLSNLHRWVGEEDKCCPGVPGLATDKRIPDVPQYIEYPYSLSFSPPSRTAPAPGNFCLGRRAYLWGYSKLDNIILAIWDLKEKISKCLLWTQSKWLFLSPSRTIPSLLPPVSSKLSCFQV